MKTILEILCRFRQINVDSSEVGCMKAIILFSPETPQLCDIPPIEMLQDQAQCILSDHVRVRYPRQQTRFGRLLLLLPSLRAIRKTTIEQLFFKETIGMYESMGIIVGLGITSQFAFQETCGFLKFSWTCTKWKSTNRCEIANYRYIKCKLFIVCNRVKCGTLNWRFVITRKEIGEDHLISYSSHRSFSTDGLVEGNDRMDRLGWPRGSSQ